MMNDIVENAMLDKLASLFPRSPLQLNRMQESDAEVVLPGTGTGSAIAVTIDSIAEEIATGLYKDPWLIGWMTVMVSMSDLAATGARPIGILISELLPKNCEKAFLERLQEGIGDACHACGTSVLGGDTNFSDELILTGCAVGTVEANRRLSRIGCRPGDLLFASGPLGKGNAYAASRLLQQRPASLTYQPRARLAEGEALAGIATACMDTSDGVLATLDQLMRLNRVGFTLDENWEQAIDAEAGNQARRLAIPPWLLLAGEHGEFELLFTAAAECESRLMARAGQIGWQPLRIGHVESNPVIRMRLYGTVQPLDTARIRNLPHATHGDVRLYMSSLLTMDAELRRKRDNIVTNA
jgi:thiamine-monophosphate kinase